MGSRCPSPGTFNPARNFSNTPIRRLARLARLRKISGTSLASTTTLQGFIFKSRFSEIPEVTDPTKKKAPTPW